MNPLPSCKSATDCICVSIFPRVSCDEDGWVLKVNKEKDYPTFMHVIQPSEIETINVLGDIEISYIGFGDESKITRSSDPY